MTERQTASPSTVEREEAARAKVGTEVFDADTAPPTPGHSTTDPNFGTGSPNREAYGTVDRNAIQQSDLEAGMRSSDQSGHRQPSDSQQGSGMNRTLVLALIVIAIVLLLYWIF